jgi:two-component system alkaline phosphatase synthesis response regulator PhoP
VALTQKANQAMQIKILIVDDMRTIRAHARSLLLAFNFNIEEAKNGKEALEIAKRFHPHLILLDVSMPEMDGIACCRELKSGVDTRDAKVIMITGKGKYVDVAEAFNAGCDDYITKPIQRHELIEKVGDILRSVQCRERIQALSKSRASYLTKERGG